MIEESYAWEMKVRTDAAGPEHRAYLLSLLADVQGSFVNIYDDHPLRRIVAFDSRRDDEYMPAYEEALERRRLLNLVVWTLREQYDLTPMVKQPAPSILQGEFLLATKAEAQSGDSKAL